MVKWLTFSRAACTVLAAVVLVSTTAAADKRPMQVEDLFRIQRVASPQISPDGKSVAYQVTTVSLVDNKSTTRLAQLSVGQTAVTKKGIRALKKALPECKVA